MQNTKNYKNQKEVIIDINLFTCLKWTILLDLCTFAFWLRLGIISYFKNLFIKILNIFEFDRV